MITTARLDLVPMTPELAAAELAGADRLAAALACEPPTQWPPDLYEADDLQRLSDLLADPANAGWALYYLLERAAPRRLVGIAGFGGRPDENGMVQAGYSVLAEFRRRGFASEALAGLVAFAFNDPSVRGIIADTYPELEASIGVLLKNGFARDDAPRSDGTIRFRKDR